MSHPFQHELAFLGVRSSARFVAEPASNRVAERFVRTLKYPLLWLNTCDMIEALRRALHAFKDLYNHAWLVQKHGHLTPATIRVGFTNPAQAAA